MHTRGPIAGGAVAGLLLLVALLLVGRLAPGEAMLLLQSSAASVRFLASAVSTASATILALMLTALSLSSIPDRTFRPSHYQRIHRISRYSTIALTLAVFLLLVFVIPLEESSETTEVVATALYYLVITASATLGGLMVAIVLLLQHAIHGLTDYFHPEADNWLVADDEANGDDVGSEPEEER